VGKYQLNCTGQTPPNSPAWVVSPSFSQDIHLSNGGTVNFLANAHYQTKSYTAINLTPTDLQKSYLTGTATLTYSPADDKWSIGAFVQNIANTSIKQYTTHTSITAAVLSPPRTYGIQAAVHFK